MDNVKKAILYHWMNAIFVRKTLPKTDFNTNNAVEVLKEAGIIVPKNKETESYLKTATNDFRAALKEGKVEELLKQFPLPSLVTEEGKDIEMESDVEEPSASEVKVTVYDFLKQSKIEVKKDLEIRGFGEDFVQSDVQDENRRVTIIFQEINLLKKIFDLKGQSNEIFDPQFFSSFEPA